MDNLTPETRNNRIGDDPDTSYLYPAIQTPYDTEQISGSHYKGWPLAVNAGPFLRKNLDRTITTLQGAFTDHKPLLALRCELKSAYPVTTVHAAMHNQAMMHFIGILHNKVRYGQRHLTGYHRSDVDASFDYLWRADHPAPGMQQKFYLLLLLNRACYDRHSMDGDDAALLKYRIRTAWADALGIGEYSAVSLIRYPDKAQMIIKSSQEDLAGLFTLACVLSRTFEGDCRIGSRLFAASR